jgi:hypothetical protein
MSTGQTQCTGLVGWVHGLHTRAPARICSLPDCAWLLRTFCAMISGGTVYTHVANVLHSTKTLLYTRLLGRLGVQIWVYGVVRKFV